MQTTLTSYESVENAILKYPESNYETFKKRTDWLFEDFEKDNGILQLLRDNKLELHHFHALLNTIFHQVYMGSTSFALGGVHTDSRHYKVREYFYSHAEEEQDHWKWIIQNLRDTGYTGADPREVFPPQVTISYLSFAMYLALKEPICRLAMGYILEGVSGALGEKYGLMAVKQLGLQPEQMTFFIKHGQLDKGHSQDILDVLQNASLTPYEWAWCVYAAECTQSFYKAMYNFAAAAKK